MEKTQKSEELIQNENLHFEHRQWESELELWEDELKSFNNRLSELVTRWTKKEVLKELEHYQNEFVLHEGIIDTMRGISRNMKPALLGTAKMERI